MSILWPSGTVFAGADGFEGGWDVDEVTVVAGPVQTLVVNETESFEGGLRDWSADQGVWEAGVPTSGLGAARGGLHGKRFSWGDTITHGEANYYASSPSSNLQGPSSGSNRVVRGGYWSIHANGCRSASRGGDFPDNAYVGMGFRVVRP